MHLHSKKLFKFYVTKPTSFRAIKRPLLHGCRDGKEKELSRKNTCAPGWSLRQGHRCFLFLSSTNQRGPFFKTQTLVLLFLHQRTITMASTAATAARMPASMAMKVFTMGLRPVPEALRV